VELFLAFVVALGDRSSNCAAGALGGVARNCGLCWLRLFGMRPADIRQYGDRHAGRENESPFPQQVSAATLARITPTVLGAGSYASGDFSTRNGSLSGNYAGSRRLRAVPLPAALPTGLAGLALAAVSPGDDERRPLFTPDTEWLVRLLIAPSLIRRISLI
jgi:hypothetical protein